MKKILLSLLFVCLLVSGVYGADTKQSALSTVTAAATDTVTGLQGGANVNFAWGANLTAIKALTFVDASILQLTGAGTLAVLTSGGNNYILGSTSDNSALEFKTPGATLTAIGGIASTALDDTKGNGDSTFIWSADKVYDQLALKAASNASTTVNGQTCTLGSTCTVTASLPSNPSACSAGEFVSDIAADGTLTCATPSGSSGDVTAVGDCASGACGDGTSDGGTYVELYSVSGNGRLANNAGVIEAQGPAGSGFVGIKALNYSVVKTSGQAGDMSVYEANSTDTHGAGFRGPASITGDGAYRILFPNARAGAANSALVVTNAGESGSGTAIDPYVQTGSWVSFDSYVTKALYDAQTIVHATTDNTPVALTVTEQTVVGRATGGNIAALAIDADLSSTSASDDTIPSAKATKAMGDLKAVIAHTRQDSATPVIDDPDNFAANFASDNLYGGTFIANAAGTAALPNAGVGMNFTYVLEGANANVIEPLATGTDDTIVLNGVALTQGHNITSSTGGAICYFQYRAANSWMATCNGFVDGT